MTDRAQARILTDPRSAAFVHPFLGRECSTAQACADAGCSITTMAYRIRVLLAAGLITVTRTEPRAGRPVRYFRSTHDAYHVPLGATGFADQAEQTRRIGWPLFRRLVDAYSTVLARSGHATRIIGRDDQGGIYSTDVPPHRTARRHPLLFEDRELHLTRDQADRLCARLDQLVTEVTEASPTDAPRQAYLVMVAAVPVED